MPPPPSTAEEKLTLTLATELQYLLYKDEQAKSSLTTPSITSHLLFYHGCDPPPKNWSPTLTFGKVDPNSKTQSIVLQTREAIPFPGPTILLEESYEIQGAYPRSVFVVMQQNAMTHSFIFDFPDHPWFNDVSGLRKSAYVYMKEKNSDTVWELHMKPSREKTNLFGYLCKAGELESIMKMQQDQLLNVRRLPLVFDLDDTLVRLVGNPQDGYVPDSHVPEIKHRVRRLKDGRSVVLADRVIEFLMWAQNYYEISVCSLGDQNYVDMVIEVLDPSRTIIRGIAYSARQEYQFLAKSGRLNQPPKDLTSLYAFACLHKTEPNHPSATSLPLIVDDRINTWPSSQQDNIIIVKEAVHMKVWTVNFKPVQRILHNIYEMFFRAYDRYIANGGPNNPSNVIPSVVDCYKQFLRYSLRDQISHYGTPTESSQTTNQPSATPDNESTPLHHLSTQRHDAVPLPSALTSSSVSTENSQMTSSSLPPPPPFPQSFS